MHKRSNTKQQTRKIRNIIFTSVFRDQRKAETVCRVNRVEILEKLAEPVDVSLVPDLVKGEILFDAKGRGSMQ